MWVMSDMDKKALEEIMRRLQPDEVAPPLVLPVAKPAAPQFKLGGKSLDRLNNLIEPMRNCVLLAITLSTQDFTVFETLRSIEQQRENLRKGATRTLASKHLRQADGMSHACDLVPWIGGEAVWDWDGCAKIAHAMDVAATRLGIANKIRWGGAWDRVLSDFGSGIDSYMAEVRAYKERHSGADFIDGPHFEWVS